MEGEVTDVSRSSHVVHLLVGGCLGMLLMFQVPMASAAHAIFPKANAMVRPTNFVSIPQWHSIEITPSPRLKKIHFYNKLNPVWWFKNADAPTPPDWFRPGEKHRVFKWHLRNPFHNFAFYVIGIADKPHIRSGRYPKAVANPNGGWNFAVAKYKGLRFPFVSYSRGEFDFYLGWRKGGNFGIKINYGAQRPPKTNRAQSLSNVPSANTDSSDSEP
jgi:hypothetical protein